MASASGGTRYQEPLGDAENLAGRWPEFFTLLTFNTEDPRANDWPKPAMMDVL
jgi:hypothetical protein